MQCRWLLLFFLFPAIQACGEEPGRLEADAQLTLGSVVEKAFQRNPRYQLLEAGATAVESRFIQARGVLPAAPAVALRHQNDKIGSGRKLQEWEAAVELPVWMPGQRSARQAVANDAEVNLTASRGSLMLDLAGRIRESVWDIALKAEDSDLAGQRYETARALQQDVEKRWKAGELAKTDLMLAQNETLQAEALWRRAQAEVKHAEHRYWLISGFKALPSSAEEPLSSLDRITEVHPALAEAEAKIRLARGERQLTQVEKRENPQLIVNARHERGAFDSAFDNSVGFAVRIPLESDVRSAPQLANSEMALAKAQSERDQLTLDLEAALHEAEHNLESIRDELKIVEEQYRLAQANLELARKAFSLGESDLVNLLRIQALAQEAEKSLRQRQIQLKLSIARYNQAVGVLP